MFSKFTISFIQWHLYIQSKTNPVSWEWILDLQGVPGAYSQLAAEKAYPNCEAVPCEQFETVFEVHFQTYSFNLLY